MPRYVTAIDQSATSSTVCARALRQDFCVRSDVGDAGYAQSFDESIDKARIIAEEELLPRRFDVVVRLALQQFGSRRFCLRPIPEKSERRRK